MYCTYRGTSAHSFLLNLGPSDLIVFSWCHPCFLNPCCGDVARQAANHWRASRAIKMVVPFGFGIFDFVDGTMLIRDVIIALKESRGAAKEFRDLITELRSFETALLHVQGYVKSRVGDEQEQGQEADADIRRIISDCRAKIDDVLNQIDEYQKRLGPAHKIYSSRARDSIAKIRFHLFRKNDIANWQRSLYAHTMSITLILTAEFSYVFPTKVLLS